MKRRRQAPHSDECAGHGRQYRTVNLLACDAALPMPARSRLLAREGGRSTRSAGSTCELQSATIKFYFGAFPMSGKSPFDEEFT